MNKSESRQAGLVLAAGASSRMGMPKPLLRLPDGKPLGLAQANLLQSAGCDPVKIVLGAREREVREALGDAETFVLNERWRQGRISSVQTGLRAVHPFSGCVLLPVDTAGVRADTICRVLDASAWVLSRCARFIRANEVCCAGFQGNFTNGLCGLMMRQKKARGSTNCCARWSSVSMWRMRRC